MLANGTLSVAHQELVIGAALKKAGHNVQIIHDVNFGFFNKAFLPEPLNEEDMVPQEHGNFQALKARVEPDIIFGLDQSVAPFALSAKHHIKKPTLCMFLDFPKHVIDEGSPVNWNPDYAKRYYHWLSCGLSLDSVIFNNKVACDEIKRRENKETELVWYPLCNLNYIEQITKKVDLEDPYVVSCHRFIAYKGTEFLVKALYGIDVKYKAISVSGNLEKQIEAHARSVLEDNFEYFPRAEEKLKLKLIANALLLCYPQITNWVGGLSPLEAMALRTPVVCFDYPVLRELYEDCAVYAKPEDIDDLQVKLITVLNDDYDMSIVDKAEARIAEHFTPDKMAERLTKVFEKYA
jgi:glycosyltransferase involved in cell wall biosynthesis